MGKGSSHRQIHSHSHVLPLGVAAQSQGCQPRCPCNRLCLSLGTSTQCGQRSWPTTPGDTQLREARCSLRMYPWVQVHMRSTACENANVASHVPLSETAGSPIWWPQAETPSRDRFSSVLGSLSMQVLPRCFHQQPEGMGERGGEGRGRREGRGENYTVLSTFSRREVR